MKLHYYPETDSLYIELSAGTGVEVREIADGLNADLDAEGRVVGLDIDHASTHLDLTKLETIVPAPDAVESGLTPGGHDTADPTPLGEVAAAPGSSRPTGGSPGKRRRRRGRGTTGVRAKRTDPANRRRAFPLRSRRPRRCPRDHRPGPEPAPTRGNATAARLDRETIGYAWPFALIPLGLVLVMLDALLGDWVWVLFPAGFLAIWALLVMMPLRHRYANELPLDLPLESGERRPASTANASAAYQLLESHPVLLLLIAPCRGHAP